MILNLITMNNYPIPYLKRYINNELNSVETAELEKAMQEDEHLSDIVLGLQMAQLENLDLNLNDLPSEMPQHIFEAGVIKEPLKTVAKNKEKGKPLFKKLLPLSAVAATVVLGVFLFQWQNTGSKKMANQYFEHYTDQISIRGEGNNLTKAMKLYNQKKYKETILLLEPICQNQNETACFYLGMSQYLNNSKNADESYSALRKVSNSSSFYPMAQFYAALSAINADRETEARIILEQIEENESYRYKEAVKLLETLN